MRMIVKGVSPCWYVSVTLLASEWSLSTGRLQRGIVVFVCLCGFPALELNGFGVGVPFTVPIAIATVVIGGAAGGALICPRPVTAGLIGGLIAGLSGFLAV